MTISWWVFFGLSVVFGLTFTVASVISKEKTYFFISLLATIVVCLAIVVFGHWYCNNTAGGLRSMKDQQSSLNNGIMREVTVTAEDGREIYYYKGRVDIETNPENKYILFETEEGMRHMIYYGITDTVLILEVED